MILGISRNPTLHIGPVSGPITRSQYRSCVRTGGLSSDASDGPSLRCARPKSCGHQCGSPDILIDDAVVRASRANAHRHCRGLGKRGATPAGHRPMVHRSSSMRALLPHGASAKPPFHAPFRGRLCREHSGNAGTALSSRGPAVVRLLRYLPGRELAGKEVADRTLSCACRTSFRRDRPRRPRLQRHRRAQRHGRALQGERRIPLRPWRENEPVSACWNYLRGAARYLQ